MLEPMELARRLALHGEISADTEAWWRKGVEAWWRDGADPSRIGIFLGLATGSRSTIAKRDCWLIRAAEELPEHERAAKLKHAIDHFLRHRWPSWRASQNPPDDASPIEACLFYACDSGATMTVTRRQVSNIIRGK